MLFLFSVSHGALRPWFAGGGWEGGGILRCHLTLFYIFKTYGDVRCGADTDLQESYTVLSGGGICSADCLTAVDFAPN